MMRLTSAAVLLLTLALPRSVTAQALPRTLHLTFETDRTVTLEAAGVSTREVLGEWARQCGCVVINGQNVPGIIEIPVRFTRAPQEAVLASLLRRAAGYALTPRRAGMTGPSQFETIYVLPTSNPSASAAFSIPQPSYAPPPPPTMGSPADEIPPVTPIPPATGGPGGPTEAPAPAASQVAPPTPRLPGMPTRFVPIVPVGPGQSTAAPPPPNQSPAVPVVTPR